MRIYLDSSALLKRAVAEPESSQLVETIDRHEAGGDLLASSTLAWIEVTRALRARSHSPAATAIGAADDALSGVSEYAISAEVVSLARHLSPPVLRSLDAIHLASALLLDADLVLAYDDRLVAACTSNGIACASPGR